MKTINADLGAFLKRTGLKLTLSFDEPTGRFLAHTKRGEGTSKHLDDALDNMLEELRRADSGTGPMRDKPVEAKPTTVSYTPPAYPKSVSVTLPSISQAGQQAWQAQQAAKTCSRCNGRGYVPNPFFGSLPCGACLRGTVPSP